ncbi:MAG: hypothetical protein ACRCUY_07480 [Thermoguttaceae bacterium]
MNADGVRPNKPANLRWRLAKRERCFYRIIETIPAGLNNGSPV